MLIGMVEELIRKACSSASTKLNSKETTSSEEGFEEILSKLIYETATVGLASQIRLDEHCKRFFALCKDLYVQNTTSAATRSRIQLVLFNIALHNVPIRRYLAGSELQLCEPVFKCLQISLKERLGPQNTIDILRLLQVLIYERCLVLGNWANPLLSLLLTEILRADEVEWLPYCVAILSNLACRSKTVCSKLKKSSSYGPLCSRLLQLLSHDSRTVVVSSLSLIGQLDEKSRETIFCTQNLPQTLLCVINVLIGGDSVMTTHIAIDLLRKLVLNESCHPPAISAIARNFATYAFFEKSMQSIAKMTMSLDVRSEECGKIYDLLLSFGNVPELQRSLCSAIIKTPVSERRLTTPCLTICRAASMPLDEVEPELPINALRLIILLLKEAVESGTKLQDLFPPGSLTKTVEVCIKTAVETKSHLVRHQCTRITEGLRLAEVIANDEDIREELLEVVSAPLCAHINEAQLISNPIACLTPDVVGNGCRFADMVNNPPKFDDALLLEWSKYGVNIPLQLLRLLSSLKDHSKAHKDLYWRSLKDERLIPFIAYALTKGDSEMVNDARVLFNHCAQMQNLPTQVPNQRITNLSVNAPSTSGINGSAGSRALPSDDAHAFQNGGARPRYVTKQGGVLITGAAQPHSNLDGGSPSTSMEADALVADMLESVRRELRIGDEVQLQRLSTMLKTTVFSRMRSSPSQNGTRSGKPAAEKSMEMRAEESMAAEVKVLQKRIENLSSTLKEERSKECTKCKTLEGEKKALAEENDKERALHLATKAALEEMTSKFDSISKALAEKQGAAALWEQQLAEMTQTVGEREQALDETKRELQESKNTVYAQLRQADELRKEIDRLKEENSKLADFKSRMAKMLSEQ